MEYEYYGELVGEMIAKLSRISKLFYYSFFLGLIQIVNSIIPRNSRTFEADERDDMFHDMFNEMFDGITGQLGLETKGVTAIILALLCQLLANYARQRLAIKKIWNLRSDDRYHH